jgi:pimeloyl-ACP methyl ester carboxylesterase
MQAISHLELEGDFRMEVEQWGHGARPLVLVHGYTGSRDDWLAQLPRLEELGLTIALDQRGHGGSSNSGNHDDYALDRLAADLVQAFDALGIDQCDLLGHSMGGIIAQLLARAAPERVASLILMDSFASGMALMPVPLRAAMGGIIDEKGMAGVADAMEAAGRSGKVPRPASMTACIEQMGFDRYYARTRAKLEAMDPAAFTTVGDGMANWPGLGDQLPEISCPTTVIVGEQDTPFREHATRLAEAIPGADHVVLPGAAHSPQLENADAWFTAIEAHLKRARG